MTDIVKQIKTQPFGPVLQRQVIEEIERLRAALMILKGVNENEEFPSVFVEDVIEAALEGK